MKRLKSLSLLPILALCFSVMGTACTLSADEAQPNVTYVVITSTPDVSAPVSSENQPQSVAQNPPDTQPTEPPLPTPTDTPKIAPDVLLSQSDRLLLDGYYEEAVERYDAVLTQSDATDDQRATAALSKGQAALRAGWFDQAVTALTLLIDHYPTHARLAHAYLLRGDAYLGLSQWQAAIADFQQYLTLRPGVIDSYIYERIGDAQIAISQYQEALLSYDRATAAERSTVPAAALREKVAQVYKTSNNTEKVVAQYDAILTFAQNAPYRATIAHHAAQALLDSGQLAAALTRFNQLIQDYPETPHALTAMQQILANGGSVDPYLQGRIYYHQQDYESAVIAFNNYSSVALLTDIPPEFYLLLGRAYRELGNMSAAGVAFDTIVKQFPSHALLGEALLEQGRTLFLRGDTPGAIAFYLNIATYYEYLPDAHAEALWRVGYLYATTGQHTLSRQTFEQLSAKHPTKQQSLDGLKLAAEQALESGDAPVAELLYSQLAQLSTGSTQAEAFLAVGRLALARGDRENANAAFTQAATAAPDSYYSARALDLRDGIAPFTRPAQFVFTFDEVTEFNAAEDWMRATFNLELPSPLWVLSPELEADPRVIRGRELWILGAFDAATTEFLDILDDHKADGLASYRLALFMRGLGAYYPSVVGAANVITAAKVSTLQAPPYIARLRYPAYYREALVRITEPRNIDPLLMYALIRHESLFNTHATAAAGEKGLTQVIPTTAEAIAQQLQWQDYQHSNLFRPYIGITFGAHYLDEQLRRFNGNVYATLAGYNAGPGRAIAWLDAAGSDPDRFMDAISIASTQLYVQRIYSHYNVYRALYGGQ